MGEKHHHDPEVVTCLHHDMLASVVGRYTSYKPVKEQIFWSNIFLTWPKIVNRLENHLLGVYSS